MLIFIHAHDQLTAEFILYYLYLKDNHISWPLLGIICVVDYHPCSLSTYSWISIVLSVLKRIITISWPLLWISCVDYHPCSTNSWIYIVLSVFKSIITISWPLLWIICIVDYHPYSLSTKSRILSFYCIICVLENHNN